MWSEKHISRSSHAVHQIQAHTHMQEMGIRKPRMPSVCYRTKAICYPAAGCALSNSPVNVHSSLQLCLSPVSSLSTDDSEAQKLWNTPCHSSQVEFPYCRVLKICQTNPVNLSWVFFIHFQGLKCSLFLNLWNHCWFPSTITFSLLVN